MVSRDYYYGLGRRKSAVARVQLHPGAGHVVVNGKPMAQMFPVDRLQQLITEPLRLTEMAGKYAVMVKVEGGGITGQAGAIRHGIARALIVADETMRPVLKKAKMLTRDAREKERKKYGLKRARKAPQYTKR